MTTNLLTQMADEFCRWHLPSMKMCVRTEGTYCLTHAEALAMFAEIVGPKIAELETELAKWTRKHDAVDLEELRLQAKDASLAAKQAYINGLEHTMRHAEAENTAQLAELHRISEALGTNDGHSSVDHIIALRKAFEKPVAVPPGLVDALRCQRQIDMEGTDVAVSRQAVDEAADILSVPLFTKPEGPK